MGALDWPLLGLVAVGVFLLFVHAGMGTTAAAAAIVPAVNAEIAARRKRTTNFSAML